MNNSNIHTRNNGTDTSEPGKCTKMFTVAITDCSQNSISGEVISRLIQGHLDNELDAVRVEEVDRRGQLFGALAGTSEREAQVLVTAAIKAVLINFAGKDSAAQLAYLYNWAYGMATVLQEDISPKTGLEAGDGLSLFDRLWPMIQLEPDPTKRVAGVVGCLNALGLGPEVLELIQNHIGPKVDERATERTASQIEGRTISTQEKDLVDKILRVCECHPANGNETLGALFGAFHGYLHESPYPMPKKLEYVLGKILGLYEGYKSATLQVQSHDGVTFEVTRVQEDNSGEHR